MTRAGILIVMCVVPVAPALAWDGVQVLEAEGQVRQHLWVAPSPTPGYCYWDRAETSGPAFSATNADGYGNMDCPDPWLVHCDGDSLVFKGVWPLIDESYVTGSEYVVDLACEVSLTAAARLVAGCTVDAVELDVNEHTLSVTGSGGATEVILDAAAGTCEAVLVFQPGTYRIVLHVRAYEHKSNDEVVAPYFGRVFLRWEDPETVTVEPISWGSFKAVYRR